MNPLPCPFCGAAPVARWDGEEPRPFYVRCAHDTCPGASAARYADGEVAVEKWNRRAQLSPTNPEPVHALGGFTTRSLMRGELVYFDLDRTGVLCSDAFRFNPHSKPLMLKPRE